MNKTKRLLFLFFVLVLTVFLFVSCGLSSKCNVTLVLDSEGNSISLTVNQYTELGEPKSQEGLVFDGWYKDRELTKKYDFAYVAADITLYAAWRDSGGETFDIRVFNGAGYDTVTVGTADLVSSVEKPTREGCIFIGWYSDIELTNAIMPNEHLCENMTLYPSFIADIELVGNKASEILKSTVGVYVTRYNTNFIGGITDSYSTSGSGVIFKSDTTHYYILTNNHVIAPMEEYSKISYTVSDAYDKEHVAELLFSSASYDLAVLRFEKGDKELTVADFSDSDARVGTEIISIGYPKGLVNSITYGELVKYAAVNNNNFDEQTDVVFDVGWHTAPVEHGSSGGVVFNYSFEIIGINYAAATDNDGNFVAGLYVPVSRVVEFLELNGLRTE